MIFNGLKKGGVTPSDVYFPVEGHEPCKQSQYDTDLCRERQIYQYLSEVHHVDHFVQFEKLSHGVFLFSVAVCTNQWLIQSNAQKERYQALDTMLWTLRE